MTTNYFMLFVSTHVISIVKQKQLTHSVIIYLFLASSSVSPPPTCFGSNFAIIKGGYIKLHRTMCIKM
jgi:hypothetical protein